MRKRVCIKCRSSYPSVDSRCRFSSVTMRTHTHSHLYTHTLTSQQEGTRVVCQQQCVQELNECACAYKHKHFLVMLIIYAAQCLRACVLCVCFHLRAEQCIHVCFCACECVQLASCRQRVQNECNCLTTDGAARGRKRQDSDRKGIEEIESG